jgi:hypothetical protein
MVIDGAESMKAILAKMRMKLLKFRPPEHVQAAVAGMAQLLKGQEPQAQVPTQGGGAALP